MEQQLLIDSVGFATLRLTESVGGVCKFTGKFQEAEQINKNKRMYPYDVLASNVEKLAETVKERGLLGECDHPQDSIVHLNNVSHLVTKLWWDKNVLMGEAEVLNTPSGKVLRALIESGARIGISSRGVGNGQVNNEGVLVIGESYKLITFDAVADPSCFAAFQKQVTNTKRENFEENVKIDSKVFVSYFGQVLQKKINEIKELI